MKPLYILLVTCVTLAMFCGCKKSEPAPEPAAPAEVQPEQADAKADGNTAPDAKADDAKADAAAPEKADDAKADEAKDGDANAPENPEAKADDAAPENAGANADNPQENAAPKPLDVTLSGHKYTATVSNPVTEQDPDNPHEVYCPDDAKCAAAINFRGESPKPAAPEPDAAPRAAKPAKPAPVPPILIFNASYIEAQSLGDINEDGNDEIAILYTNTGPIAKWREFLIYGLKDDNGSKHWAEIAPSLPTNLTILWTAPYIPVEKSDKPGFVKVRHIDCTNPIDVETFQVVEKEVEISKLREYVPQDSGKKE